MSGRPKPGTTTVGLDPVAITWTLIASAPDRPDPDVTVLDPQRELLQPGDELVETIREDGQQLGLGGLVRVGAIVIRPSWKILTRLRM